MGSAVAGNIKLLAVVDSLDPTVGMACEETFTVLDKFLTEARPSKDALPIFTFERGVFTPAGILEYYRTEPFGKEDVLWFYYCGHGGMDAQKGHFLKTTQGDLVRRELREVMESRKTQGVLITTDACSVPAQAQGNGLILHTRTTVVVQYDPWKVVQEVVGNIEGTVDITAATGENRAFIHDELRGNFTNGLVSLLFQPFEGLDLDGNGMIDWRESFSFLRAETQNYFSNMKNEVGQDQWLRRYKENNQIPYAFSLGKKVEEQLRTHGYNKKIVKQIFAGDYGPYGAVGFHSGEGIRLAIEMSFDHLRNRKLMLVAHLLDPEEKPIPAHKTTTFSSKGGGIEFIREIAITHDFAAYGPNEPFEILIPYDAIIGPKPRNPIPLSDGTWDESDRMKFGYLEVIVYDSTTGGKSPILYQEAVKLSRSTPSLPRSLPPKRTDGQLLEPPVPSGKSLEKREKEVISVP